MHTLSDCIAAIVIALSTVFLVIIHITGFGKAGDLRVGICYGRKVSY